ncbi:MAG: Trm112 family protein [Pseudomonadota bacterium]
MSDESGSDGRRGDQPHAAVSPRLLETLVCPSTGGRLSFDPDRQELVSKSANVAYPVRQGIPIMLIDEARTLEE